LRWGQARKDTSFTLGLPLDMEFFFFFYQASPYIVNRIVLQLIH
jgi:hypothetical protein